MNIKKKKAQIEALDFAEKFRKPVSGSCKWTKVSSFNSINVGKNVHYFLGSFDFIHTLGFDKNINLICIDIWNKQEKERYKRVIKKIDKITNVHPNIKNHFNMPLKKSEVYL